MWQRKQTVFLVITSLCMILCVFFPIWVGVQDDTRSTLFPLHYSVITGDARTTTYYPFSITAMLAIAAATVSIIEIGKFEKRLLQLKLGTLNSLFMAGTLVAMVVFTKRLMQENTLAGEYGLAFWLPAVAMVSNLIANRFIRKDEKLIRDSERIR